jgi:hypothetical protein
VHIANKLTKTFNINSFDVEKKPREHPHHRVLIISVITFVFIFWTIPLLNGLNDGITDIDPEIEGHGLTDPQQYKQWVSQDNREETKLFKSSVPAIGSDHFLTQLAKFGERFYPKGRGRRSK